MLMDLHHPNFEECTIRMGDFDGKVPFKSGIEYSCPARGNWTIAHTPMLIPGAHMIYIGASACLHGVVLSTAEYDGMDRFSMVLIEENNLLHGDMEELFIEGVTDILEKLPKLPTAVFCFTSCIHYFMAVDRDYVYEELEKRFPTVDFLRSDMLPTMKKTDRSPEEMIRKSMLDGWKEMPKNDKAINLIGSNEVIKRSSEYIVMLEKAGYEVRDLCEYYDYEDYENMGSSFLNIYSMPVAAWSASVLEERLGQKSYYLPNSWDFEEIETGIHGLADLLGIERPDLTENRMLAKKAIQETKELIGDTPIAIDYLATTRFFGLAKLLVEHGFNVTEIYGDGIMDGDLPAAEWLRNHAPDTLFKATIDFRARYYRDENNANSVLAIGQKAAYFNATNHFVNMIENNGWHGYDGIVRLCDELKDAFLHEKDTRAIIQVKAWGCSA